MRKLFVVLLFLAFLSPCALFAQNALRIDLSGEWRFVAGDRPEFASPDFDDNQRPTFTLPRGPYNAVLERSRGGPRRSWLRRRVELPAGVNRSSLTLTLGTIQSVYEVYVNGQRIGASGNFETFADAEIPRPRTFAIPASAIPASATGDGSSLLLALRINKVLNMPPAWRLPDEGPYLLTNRENAPSQVGEQAIANHRLKHAGENILLPIMFVIPLLSLLGWLAERRQRELLWFSIAAFAYAAGTWNTFALLSSSSRPFNQFGTTVFQIAAALVFVPLYSQFVLVALKLRQRWLRVLAWLGWTAAVVASHFGFRLFLIRTDGMFLSSALPLMFIAWFWFRQRSRSGWVFPLLLALPILPEFLYWFNALTDGQFLSRGIVLEGLNISLEDLCWLCTSSALLALLLRRVYRDLQDRQRLAGELESARTIQRMLLPEHGVAGALGIDAAYEPAREVGGDFYQILEGNQGARIVLVGDVSGKGLEAAMVAAAAVGAFRSLESDSPATLLAGLNRALTGQGRTGFVTCCCARFEPSGRVVFASAGHPSPYLDGRELQCEAGLPLGVVTGSEYQESEAVLVADGQFTFVSDGVVEAENNHRELFGFERTAEICGKSAQQIADAAKAWGQNDDITVVTVRRVL